MSKHSTGHMSPRAKAVYWTSYFRAKMDGTRPGETDRQRIARIKQECKDAQQAAYRVAAGIKPKPKSRWYDYLFGRNS